MVELKEKYDALEEKSSNWEQIREELELELQTVREKAVADRRSADDERRTFVRDVAR